jgi:hypothetical protein
MCPVSRIPTKQWTNSMVTAAIKDNGTHTGVARTEYSQDAEAD